MPRVRRKVPKTPVAASGPVMQAPAVVHWGPGVPPDRLTYINDHEAALVRDARKFKGRRDVGGIPAYPDPYDTADGDWMHAGGGAANGYGAPGSGSSGGVTDGGGIASGGFGSGAMGSTGGSPAAPASYPSRGDYQGATPSAVTDIMAAARSLAPAVGAAPDQKAAFDKWRAEIGKRALAGFPEPQRSDTSTKTGAEISIPTPGPQAVATPATTAPATAPSQGATAPSGVFGPRAGAPDAPEGLLGPRETATSNFDVPALGLAASAGRTPKIVDRIAPSPGYGMSAPLSRPRPSGTATAWGGQETAQPGPADIPSPSLQSATDTYYGGRPVAELTPLNPSAAAPSTVGSVAPQMSNIGAKSELAMQTMRKNGAWTPPNSGPYDVAQATPDQVVAPTSAAPDPRAFAGLYPSRGTPDPNASTYAGAPEDVPPEVQVAANPSATSTPWGGYFDVPARTAGTTLPKNPLTGNLMNLRKQVLASVRDAMPPAVGDTTVADTTDPAVPPGLLDNPRMGDVAPPPQDYFNSPAPSTGMAFAARGDGGGIRQDALATQHRVLGGGKKTDKPDDTPKPRPDGPRGRYGLPDWYWQWYRTAGQYGAPGLLG